MTNQEHLGLQVSNYMGEATFERIREKCWENMLRNKSLVTRSITELPSSLAEKKAKGSNAALVIASGPSIHQQKSLEKIATLNFPGILIVADSILAQCLKHDIIPDIVVTVDPHQRVLRWFGDMSLDTIKIEADDYFRRQEINEYFAENEIHANHETIELINKYGHHVKAAIASCAASGIPQRCLESGMEMYWWNPMYDDYDLPESFTRKVYEEIKLPFLNAGGNVGTASWVLAHSVLGIEQIGLVGMDFAYYNNTPLIRTQYYREAIELFGEEKLEKLFIHIHNPYLNQDFYTDPAYFWYRQVFLEMVQDSPCRTYNCTEGGILFGEGIDFIPLSEFSSILSD